MIWNKHSELRNKHSFLSPSQCAWIGYDDEKVVSRYYNSYSQQIGTLMHSFAESHIEFKIKLTKSNKQEALLSLLKERIPREAIDMDYIYPNLQAYVNDAIKYDMDPEVILYYSDRCFGTADAIKFDGKLLRIHDLKTGKSQTHMEQLLIYAALFCLEYMCPPENIEFELRIYQNSEIVGYNPEPKEIQEIMDIIVHNDDLLNNMQGGEAYGQR